jgi:hypothetical protein
MANITRHVVNSDLEKKIITGMIVSDEYCSVVMKMGIKRQYFKIEYARTVQDWIREYFQKYGKSPGKNIQDIFVSEQGKMREAETEIIAHFLDGLSVEYERSPELDAFLVDQTETYFRERNLSLLFEKAQNRISKGKIDEAEKIVGDFKRREKSISIINGADWLNKIPPLPDQILNDTFDKGDKVAVIGSSKLRKSFFLLQMALSFASGKDFLSWTVPIPRKVFYIQFEIQEHHFHRRMVNMARTLSITPENLEDRFHIMNARGLGLTGEEGINKIASIVDDCSPEVIFLDPLYKVASGVENAAEDFKIILNAFDKLAENTGASIVFVHHDTKGQPGDKDIRDRGAGSNVLGRDYDACITLTAHASGDPNFTTTDILLRNYKPQEPFTIKWAENLQTGGYGFELAPDVLPTKQTSANRKKQADFSLEQLTEVACATLATAIMDIAQFREDFKSRTGLPDSKIKDFLRRATEGDNPQLETKEDRGRGKNKKVIAKAGIIYKDVADRDS